MPLSTSLVASVVGALIETAAQSPQPSDVPVAQYRMLAARGALPPEAKVGFMRPPIERGVIVIDDESLALSPAARIRNQKNMIVMPMAVRQPSHVVYINNNFGAVHRVWLISQAEAETIRQDSLPRQ